MLPNQQEKRFAADELAPAKNRVTVTPWFRLLHELQSPGMTARSRRVGFLISRTDNDADIINPGRQDLFYNNPQSGLGKTVAVHQRLQRECPLAFARGGDNGFFDFHRD